MEVIRSRGVALVHLYGLRANLPGRPLARRAGTRAVVAGIRSTDPWRKWYHVMLDRWTARWVDCFISNSEAGRQMAIARERFDPARVITIHSGIDAMPQADSFDVAALRRQFGLSPSAHPVVAVVANLGPEKRHCDLIEAAAFFVERFPEIVFLCAGRDEMNGANQRLAAKRGVGERFRWLGHVRNVGEVVAAADFVALPSSHEGLPVSILEAMAMGRTVVATRVGGVPEIVQDGVNGLLVPPREPKALAQAIERLAADGELRHRLEKAALETIRRDFSMERMVYATEKIYLELIKENSEC
jgi:glycosyltransferase involved in cell wall biosynthesis